MRRTCVKACLFAGTRLEKHIAFPIINLPREGRSKAVMICDVFVLGILASWRQNHNVLRRIASTLCPPLEQWRFSAVISSSTTTGPMSWRWLMLSPKNISRLPSRVSSFRSVVSDWNWDVYRWTTHTHIHTHTHMLRTIFPDIWQWVNTYRYILVGWTSIYQLFWGSLGTRVLTHPHLPVFKAFWLQKVSVQALDLFDAPR